MIEDKTPAHSDALQILVNAGRMKFQGPMAELLKIAGDLILQVAVGVQQERAAMASKQPQEPPKDKEKALVSGPPPAQPE